MFSKTSLQLFNSIRIKSILIQIIAIMTRLWVRYIPLSIFRKKFYDLFCYGDHSYVSRTKFGFNIRGNKCEMQQRFIYYFGVYEPNLSNWISQRLQSGDVFIDIGSNIGYYTLLAGKLVGDTGKIVSIEASDIVYRKLIGNIRLNKLQNVTPIHCAVTNTMGRVKFFYGKKSNEGLGSIIPEAIYWNEKESSVVNGAPLTSLLSDEVVKRARIIKMDIEGAEWMACLGMQPLFQKFPNNIEFIIEIVPQFLSAQSKTPNDLIEIFEAQGFHPYIVDDNYDPCSYLFPKKLSRPERLHIDIKNETDVNIIFSKVDSEYI